MIALDTSTLDTIRRRRQAGERLPDLAVEAGLTWQKLDKLLRHGLPDVPREESTGGRNAPLPSTLPTPLQAPNRPQNEPHTAPSKPQNVPRSPFTLGGSPALPGHTPAIQEAFTRHFQPKSLGDILGQWPIVGWLQNFVRSPHPAAFLFEGGTGVGKTSTALALAAELGCDIAAGALGGVRAVASGEQTADAVREAVAALHLTPMLGRGWKVLIVNEADRMSTAAETIWLDALEALPPHSVVIFTTNRAAKLSDRFQDRCVVFHFAGDVKTLYAEAARLLERVWRECTGRAIPAKTARRLLRAAERDRTLSFRRVLQQAEVELMAPKEA